MIDNERHDQLARLVRRSFEGPVSEDTRQALQQELKAFREATRADTETPHMLQEVRRPARFAWAVAVACLLPVVLGAVLLMSNRFRGTKGTPTTSYACATASPAVSYARCAAVFYSKKDPTVWIERRMAVLDRQGKVTTAIAYNSRGGRL